MEIFQLQIVSVPEDLQRCQWHQSTENPSIFHTEQKNAALHTCDMPEQHRTLGINGLNTAENYNRLSRVNERYRQTTDTRNCDGKYPNVT